MSLSTLNNTNLVLFPDTLHQISKKELDKYTNVYIVEDPNYFTMWPFTKIKLAYMRACMQTYFKDLKKVTNTVSIYIEAHEFTPFFKSLKECTMYYPNDLSLKQRYEAKAKVTYIYNCPNFLLSVNDDIYKENIKRHSAFYRRMKDKVGILQSTSNQDKLNRSKPSKDYSTAVRPEYIKLNRREYIDASNYVFERFSSNPGPHKDAHELIEYLKYYPITRSQAKKHFKYFLDNYYSGFKFQDYINKDEVFVNHSNISCVLNNGLLSSNYVIKEAYKYGKQSNVAINNIEGFIRQVLGWREYMRYVYHIECNEINNDIKKIKGKPLANTFWRSSSDNIVIHEEYEKVMKYGYSHHIVRLMVFLNMMKLQNISVYDIIKWFSCVHIDAYPWVMYSNVLAMGYFNKGYMSKAYVSSSNYIIKNSNYKKNGEWDKEWDRLYRLFVSKRS